MKQQYSLLKFHFESKEHRKRVLTNHVQKFSRTASKCGSMEQRTLQGRLLATAERAATWPQSRLTHLLISECETVTMWVWTEFMRQIFEKDKTTEGSNWKFLWGICTWSWFIKCDWVLRAAWSCRELRTWCCHCGGSSCCYGSGLISGPRTSTSQKKKRSDLHYKQRWQRMWGIETWGPQPAQEVAGSSW